jgi:hypothetical protein
LKEAEKEQKLNDAASEASDDENHTIPQEKPKRNDSAHSGLMPADGSEATAAPASEGGDASHHEQRPMTGEHADAGENLETGNQEVADIENIELTGEGVEQVVDANEENGQHQQSEEQVDQTEDQLNQTQEEGAVTGGESGDEGAAAVDAKKEDGGEGVDQDQDNDSKQAAGGTAAAARKETKRKPRAHKHDSNLIPEEEDDEVS